MLEGDSLAYHLPNAAAWAHAHSLWTTTTHYWWYPPGSELFASGLYTVGGPFSVGLSGTVAVLLLGLRLADWASLRCPDWVAGTIAAATISVPAIALQSGTLENDVWLAAFFLEALWAFRYSDRFAGGKSIAVLALVKPLGIAYAVLAGLTSMPSSWKRTAFALVPLGIWIAHDAVLLPGAAVGVQVGVPGGLWESTILGHGFGVAATLARAIFSYGGVATCVLLVAAFVLSPLLEDRGLPLAAVASAVVYLMLPFAYSTNVPQLNVGGHSLRFLIPVIVIGALGISWLGRRSAWLIGSAAGIAAIFGIFTTAQIFWNDATTHRVALVALIAALCICVPANFQKVAVPIGMFVAVVASNSLAQSHPVGYYNDWLRSDRRTTKLFTWLSANTPKKLVVLDLRSGAVNVISPRTLVVDATDSPCERARATEALLLLGPDSRYDVAQFKARRAAVLLCGKVVFKDALSAVVRPTPPRDHR